MKTLLLTLAMAAAAFGADITGTWKGSAETPNGTIERTFVFKQDGEKLTGETSSDFTGTSAITDGKVTGDDVTFTIQVNIQGEQIKLSYKGKVAGSEMKLHVETPDGSFSVDYVAKKVS